MQPSVRGADADGEPRVDGRRLRDRHVHAELGELGREPTPPSALEVELDGEPHRLALGAAVQVRDAATLRVQEDQLADRAFVGDELEDGDLGGAARVRDELRGVPERAVRVDELELDGNAPPHLHAPAQQPREIRHHDRVAAGAFPIEGLQELGTATPPDTQRIGHLHAVNRIRRRPRRQA